MSWLYGKIGVRSNWAPASYTANSTPEIFDAPVGMIVRGAWVRVRTAFDGTTPAASLGDDGDVDRFITTALSAVDSTWIKPNQNTSAGLVETQGYLYSTANTIDVAWTQG